MAGQLDDSVVSGVVNTNFKTLSEQLAFNTNHQMQLANRAMEDALQDQRNSRLLSTSIIGSLTKRIVESDIEQAVANRQTASADVPSRIIDASAANGDAGVILAAMASFAQIVAKLGQSTPPQTADVPQRDPNK